MKHLIILICLLNVSSANAEVLWTEKPKSEPTPSESVIGTAREKIKEAIGLKHKPDAKALTTTHARTENEPKTGNLDPHYLSRNYVRLEQTSIAVVRPDKSVKSRMKGMGMGDVLIAHIPHSVIAFPDERAPVLAEVDSGSDAFRGLRLVGSSRLEPNSHRIMIEFKNAVQDGKIFEIKAVGLSAAGIEGLDGEYHSREGAYFAGDFIASTIAAYFDGLVPRTTNVFGQPEPDTSVDSALKKGLAGGAMSTAERFKEKLKKVPEFSELKGPTGLRVLILE